MRRYGNEVEFLAGARETVRVARELLAGTLGVIEGSRALAQLRGVVSDDEFDADFLPFVGIDSETDHLPLGDQRHYWAEDALREKDRDIEKAEAVYRERARLACERLVERFGQDV